MAYIYIYIITINYLELVDLFGKSRQIYHTLIVLDWKRKSSLAESLIVIRKTKSSNSRVLPG